VLIHELYKISPEDSIFVGDLATDKTFAERCKIKYYHPDKFFK
jgi:histidinol phosphatase-like enzyme